MNGLGGGKIGGGDVEHLQREVGDRAVGVVTPIEPAERPFPGRERVEPGRGVRTAGHGQLRRSVDRAGHHRVGHGRSHRRRAASRHADDGDVRVGPGEIVEQSLDGAARKRMVQAGGDLGSRLEHESPGDHPRMRQRERGSVEDDVVVEEEVEIERPRAPMIAPFTVQRVLHGGEHAEHVVGGQARLDQTGAVEKRRLPGGAPHRPRLPVAADGEEGDAGHAAQEFDGTIELLAAAAEIRAASDEASCHGVSCDLELVRRILPVPGHAQPIQTALPTTGDETPPAADAAKNGGDIQATTKVVDCRSLKSSPPNFTVDSRRTCRWPGNRSEW